MASAQEGGVFIDPDSPAGTEYAIPLDQARREATGGKAGPGSTSAGQEPLFGAGITRRGEERQSGRGNSRSGVRQAGEGGDDEPASEARDEPASEARDRGASSAAIAAAAGDGSWDTLVTAGIAAAVLALGLVAGLAFRRATKGP
jgi:hypothetical protein